MNEMKKMLLLSTIIMLLISVCLLAWTAYCYHPHRPDEFDTIIRQVTSKPIKVKQELECAVFENGKAIDGVRWRQNATYILQMKLPQKAIFNKDSQSLIKISYPRLVWRGDGGRISVKLRTADGQNYTAHHDFFADDRLELAHCPSAFLTTAKVAVLHSGYLELEFYSSVSSGDRTESQPYSIMSHGSDAGDIMLLYYPDRKSIQTYEGRKAREA